MNYGQPDVTRPSVLVRQLHHPIEAEGVEEADRLDDLRLFAITWAAGFVFFLIFFA